MPDAKPSLNPIPMEPFPPGQSYEWNPDHDYHRMCRGEKLVSTFGSGISVPAGLMMFRPFSKGLELFWKKCIFLVEIRTICFKKIYFSA